MAATIFYRLTLVIALSFASLSANADYNFSTFCAGCFPADINDAGQIAGYAFGIGGSSQPQAVLINGTSITGLGTLGGASSYGYGINA